MADIAVRAPRRADIDALLANLRESDRAEMEAASGPDLWNTVRSALHISPHRYAMEVDGELALLGGVAVVSLLGGVGSPWLLGTRVLDRVPGALTRTALLYRDISIAAFPILYNYVDARNVKTHRWLRRLGFTLAQEATPYGVAGLPFYRFELRS